MTYLYLDIETLPSDRADVRELLARKVTHPGTISKPETIAKWNAESRPAAIDEAVAKTGLDGTFGRVCVIGWAIDDGPVQTVSSATDELGLLVEFLDRLKISHQDLFSTCVIGHNITGFDLRFLVQRHIVHGIQPNAVIHRASQAKPWEIDKVYDTMVQWSGGAARPGGSLEKLCMALSIKSPKGEIDGSQVAAAVAAGRIEEVAAYCKRDVEAVRQVHARMTFQDAPNFTPLSIPEQPQSAAEQQFEDINF